MLKKIAQISAVISFIFVCAALVSAQEISNYLITSNIGDFIASVNPTSGKGPGIVVGADHFYRDHADMTYRISYFNLQTKVGPEIQVAQHAGSYSDKWLLHEVEDSYRDKDDSDKRLGLLSGAGIKIREVGSNKFIYWGLGGGSYTWISGQKVVEIQYTDLQRTKPEPIEVVQAYLQKHPSTIPTNFSFDQAHDIQWIKDEMDRRLWLCDKWFMQLQLRKTDEKQVYQETVKSMKVFLDYREKYYSIKAVDEKNLLENYLMQNNGTGIKAKLTEYKNWWTLNKDKPITL
jgi:hypothetical protein